MLTHKRSFVFAALAVIVARLIVPLPATADVTGCTAQVAPLVMTPGGLNTATFRITNTSPDPVQWMKISRPSDRFVVGGISQSGWVDSTDEAGTELTSGSLNGGQEYTVALGVTTSIVPTTGALWNIQVSDDPGGSNAVTCTGQLETQIQGHLPNEDEGVGVSDVQVSRVSTNSATISWVTDSPMSSLVYYGATSEYGLVSAYSAAETLNHSLSLTGLAPGAVYHFQVAGMDSGMSVAYSADNTFATQAAPAFSLAGPTGSAPGLTQVARVPTDVRPPAITLASVPAGIFAAVPEIVGTVTDDVGLVSLEYSIDDGRNWILVPDLEVAAARGSSGSATVARFSIRPVLTAEGNYYLRLRATDAGANITAIGPFLLILDRLAPQPGPLVVRVGDQTIVPDALGRIVLPQDTDFKLALSVVGGALTVAIAADQDGRGSRYSLAESQDSNVWTGVMRFGTPGTYDLQFMAADGAGRQSAAALGSVEVVEGVAITAPGANLNGAAAEIMVHDARTSRWLPWDGRPYGQVSKLNLAGSSGILPVLLPSGRYYIKIRIPGRFDRATQPFTIEAPTALTGRLDAVKGSVWEIGPLAIPMPLGSLFAAPVPALSVGEHPIVGRQLPITEVSQGSGSPVLTADWYGRPTVLLIGAGWMPDMSARLAEFGKLSQESDVNAVAVFVHESSQRAAVASRQVSGHILSDPDGELYARLGSLHAPAFVFIDRQGIIKKVMVGELTAGEVLDFLGKVDEVRS